jgi:sec-independent protein translocase protein TatC
MLKQSPMSMWDHLGEMRRRVIWIVIVFLVTVLIGFYLAEDVIAYLLTQPEAAMIEGVVIGVTDAFKIYLQFAMAIGLVLTFPFALYQIWRFVSPGLTSKEKRSTLAFIPGSILLFVVGLSFGYFWLFPFIVRFMTRFADRLGVIEMYSLLQYFSFLFRVVLPFGFLFQLPLLITFLTGLGLVTPDFLKRIRKYAYFGLFVTAALITPPELLSHLFVTVPLLLLYEASILLSGLAYRKREKRLNK